MDNTVQKQETTPSSVKEDILLLASLMMDKLKTRRVDLPDQVTEITKNVILAIMDNCHVKQKPSNIDLVTKTFITICCDLNPSPYADSQARSLEIIQYARSELVKLNDRGWIIKLFASQYSDWIDKCMKFLDVLESNPNYTITKYRHLFLVALDVNLDAHSSTESAIYSTLKTTADQNPTVFGEDFWGRFELLRAEPSDIKLKQIGMTWTRS